jgi:hypothetical protein
LVAVRDLAKTWLMTETLLGLAPNTPDASACGLDDIPGFCQRADLSPVMDTRADLARYVDDLHNRELHHRLKMSVFTDFCLKRS